MFLACVMHYMQKILFPQYLQHLQHIVLSHLLIEMKNVLENFLSISME